MHNGRRQTVHQGGTESASGVFSFWQPRSVLPLGDADASEIVANLTGFFDVLLDWQSKEREEAALGKIEVESQ